MALQVWLPLNGNIENQGLSDIKTTSLGLTSGQAGKIGSAYSFDNGSQSGQGISLNSNLVSELGTQQSIAVWVKPMGNHVHYNGTIISSGDWNSSCWSFGLSQDNSQVDLFAHHYNRYVDCPVPINTWTHLACVNDNGTCSLYKNGVLVSTTTGWAPIKQSDATNTCIGRETYASGYFGFNGCIQDVRIYNHCLSPKEVKEISKGLVLHYKMDDEIATNLVKNHTYNIYNNYGVPASLTKLNETFQGCDIYRLTMTPNSTYISSFQTELGSHGVYGFGRTFKANTKYCFWIYYRPVSHSDVRVGGTASNISGWTEIPPAEYGGGWKVVGQYRNGSVTSDKTDNIFTSFYCPSAVAGTDITIDFCCPHLIEGFSEIIDDGDYQETNSHTTVYDCSGFGYNGIAYGNLITDSDTSRYSSSIKFPVTTTDYIEMNNSSVFSSLDNCTISWWGKYDGTRSLLLTGQSTDYYVAAGEPGFYHSNVTGTLSYYVDGVKSSSVPSYTSGQWHYYTITGVNITSWTKFLLNHYGDHTTQWGIQGKISDFRIYATPLSAEDVKELYNTSAIVCDNGTVMAYSLEE